jgi:alkylmercury lyase
MQTVLLEEIAVVIANGLRCANPLLCCELVRSLAAGTPVSLDQLATALQLSGDQVTEAVQRLPDIEFDDAGRVVGFGLTLVPTIHRFCIDDKALFIWCAFDTLMYPALLGKTAQISSTCPISAEHIEFRVTPDGVNALQPAQTVMSLVPPLASQTRHCDRAQFCEQGFFFASRAAATAWQATHPDALIFSVDDAYRLGHLVAAYQYDGATSTTLTQQD